MRQASRPLFNPFPGLRPFESHETHLFFGRDNQSDEMLKTLRHSRFLAVVGTSGSGKSSLVRAGLLPALTGGLMTTAGSSWRTAIFRPGGDPIGNLATALDGALATSKEAAPAPLRRSLLEAVLRRGSLGFVHAVQQARLTDDNFLIVVDQFEELFRFKQALPMPQEDSAALVRLLLEASRQRDVPIYVVLTMRSDFLGDCAQFRDLPEALNGGQYLIPRMTRDQRREAIEGPVAVGGAAVAPPLVQRLLNDVGDDPDQLPILQHALMRTFDHWKQRGTLGEPIKVEDYEGIGGMSGALSRHADEAYEELPTAGRRIAEKLFQCLTEKGPDNRELRRPSRLGRICEVAEAGLGETVAVIDVFRGAGRSFLMPPEGAELDAESLVDISHESLIRHWGRLRNWVEEEARSQATYLRVVDAALRRRSGEGGLWRDPELKLALDWKARLQPNQAWAGFYHPEFDLAMTFLEDSKREREAEIRDVKRKRAYVLAALTAVLAATMAALAARAWHDRGVAVQAQTEAQRAEKEANRQRQTAVAKALEAEASRAEAERQTTLAKKQQEEALRQREEAERQRRIAERERDEAFKQRQIAEAQTRRAEEQQQSALQQRRTLGELFVTLQPAVVQIFAAGRPKVTGNTAFFVSSDGLLVTAGHVAFSLQNRVIKVRTSDSTEMPARILQMNRAADLALLKAEARIRVEPLRLADTPVRPGSRVVALGMSPDQGWVPTSGTVRAVNVSERIWEDESRTDVVRGGLIDVEMKIEPGFSGAPVADVNGNVIGIVAYGSEAQPARSLLIPARRIKDAFGEIFLHQDAGQTFFEAVPLARRIARGRSLLSPNRHRGAEKRATVRKSVDFRALAVYSTDSRLVQTLLPIFPGDRTADALYG